MTAQEGFGKGAAVRLVGLVKSYETTAAVRSVSLEIGAGEFFTLLGPSGSGKTTVLMAIAGFIPLTAGEIYIGGEPVTHLPPYRRSVGMVFQSYALFPHMTVAENIGFPLKMRRLSREEIRRRVAWALGLIRLEGHEGIMLGTYVKRSEALARSTNTLLGFRGSQAIPRSVPVCSHATERRRKQVTGRMRKLSREKLGG